MCELAVRLLFLSSKRCSSYKREQLDPLGGGGLIHAVSTEFLMSFHNQLGLANVNTVTRWL